MKKINNKDIINNLKFLSKKYTRLSWKELCELHKKRDLICTPGNIYKKFDSIKDLLSSVGIEYYNLPKGDLKRKINREEKDVKEIIDTYLRIQEVRIE